ncbi:hypothetical protein EN925_16440 [Mesorhizobium sp. M7A.F.Ca.US.006.04.2.1]|uniref:hypothetical protein n=1 Tax=unclassified Mesorhizobium TaxID=325217 RepID=UPI000FCC74AD|nr:MULTISPECIES: hypothetical protein [unclassified Mesorhizobium]MBZ9886903.1 hypothetical protein [Mesorhizobium sp. BR1-1-3]RUX74109.1 hypothetical protein EN990_18800 [Mesorhizobium sp. M7A.F.Ca.US.005.03.1.1]RUY18120.1 hypothetical protein EN991_05260 [Mesorhizobium sp. M7A.F.Ca.US.005.03.2.1]RUY31686.1 hypothetical protein EN979_02010 [Mesorhizobium sp. M7A.F.Ca.US.001.04.2.1]RUY44126.1 hypothetical protein EN978_07270 [Mesorhizobium sp. M7A.F.Ca.US.001.04.1.1]
MGGEAMLDDDNGAAEIAAEWGVDLDLLNDASWELETIDGNDGETYGFLVRFDRDTDPDLLVSLGVDSGSLTREVSLNAFDKPDREPDE